jgi:hypothetical protein
MINFLEFLNEEISENDLDEMANHLTWEDIEDLYSPEEFVLEDIQVLDEKISATSRLKKSQKLKSRKTAIGTARKMRLRRTSTIDVLHKRATAAARRLLQKRILRGRGKKQLSAQQKDHVEQQIKNMMAIQGNLAVKLMPKIRALERSRLSTKRK